MATSRQKKAAQLLVENSSRPMKEVLAEAGYSKATQIKPSQVIKSPGFQKVLENAGITDELLAEKLKAGLNAKRPYGKNGEIYDDFSTQHKFVETNLRLKGHSKEVPNMNFIMPVIKIIDGRKRDTDTE